MIWAAACGRTIWVLARDMELDLVLVALVARGGFVSNFGWNCLAVTADWGLCSLWGVVSDESTNIGNQLINSVYSITIFFYHLVEKYN